MRLKIRCDSLKIFAFWDGSKQGPGWVGKRKSRIHEMPRMPDGSGRHANASIDGVRFSNRHARVRFSETFRKKKEDKKTDDMPSSPHSMSP